MPTIHQFRVRWAGMVGAPGVSTFYCSGTPATFKTALEAFFTADKSLYPSSITITVPNTGSDIDSGSGLTVGVWSSGSEAPITCTGTGSYAAPAGMVVNWHTGAYINGRELRGKTFLVPTVVSTMATNGTLTDTDRAGVQADANTLRSSAATMVIYSPTSASIATVTSATVPDKVAVLRSRRD